MQEEEEAYEIDNEIGAKEYLESKKGKQETKMKMKMNWELGDEAAGDEDEPRARRRSRRETQRKREHGEVEETRAWF